MPEPIAYLKGAYVPVTECRLPVYDLGIVMGAAVTDFLRTFNQQPYRTEDHIKRFYESCKYARIKPAVSYDESLAITHKLIEHNAPLAPAPGSELGLVYYMTAGENPLYAGAAGMPSEMTATYVQHTFPLPFELWRSAFIDGIHCVTPATCHLPPQTLSSKIKHRNRLHMYIGDQEAKLADPKAVSLYMDLHGNLTETAGSNFVIYRDGEVISPTRNNILWGVSLEAMREIVLNMGMQFTERDIHIHDAVNADEAWLPTTPYCLGPVIKINGIPLGNGTPGPIWRKVIDQWSNIVNKDIYKEITAT